MCGESDEELEEFLADPDRLSTRTHGLTSSRIVLDTDVSSVSYKGRLDMVTAR